MSYDDLILKSIKKAREQTRTELSNPDHGVIQAVTALDEYNDLINRVYEKLFIWYDFYFPELKDMGLEIDEYAKLALANDFNKKPNLDFLSPSMQEKIFESLKHRMGSDPIKKDLVIVKKIASDLVSLFETRDQLDNYIETVTVKLAPNMCSIAPAIVVALLFKHAGGLKKLSMEPASTIQVFGAEKALFKHLKMGSSPPKHGVLFQIPDLAKFSRGKRGKVSRLFATQLTIASKADYFTHRDISKLLKENMAKRLKEIEDKPGKPESRSSYSEQRRGNDDRRDRRPRDRDRRPRDRRDSDRGPSRDRRDSDRGPPRERRDSDRGPPRERRDSDRRPPRERRDSDRRPPREGGDRDRRPPREGGDRDRRPPREGGDRDRRPPREGGDRDRRPSRYNDNQRSGSRSTRDNDRSPSNRRPSNRTQSDRGSSNRRQESDRNSDNKSGDKRFKKYRR